MRRRIGAVVAAFGVATIVFVLPAWAAPTVHDRCHGTKHTPLDDGPSHEIFGLTLPRWYQGKPLTINVDGPGGPRGRSGNVASDGRTEVKVPLYDYGAHTVTSADVGGEAIPPGDVVPGGSFNVDADEQPCSAAGLQAAPADAPATTTTSTTTTTAPVAVVAPTTTSPTTTTTTTTAPLVLAPTEPTTSTSTTSTTTTPASAGDDVIAASAGSSSTNDGDASDGGSIFFPALIGAGALLTVTGLGIRITAKTTTADDPSDASAADLARAFETSFGTTTTVDPRRLDESWRLLTYQEKQIQQHIEHEVTAVLDGVGAGLAAYQKALDDYRTTFSRTLSASTEMQGMLVEWDEVREIARKQDLAFGVITFAWSAGSLGVKAVKWLRTPKVVSAGPRSAAEFYKAYNEALQAADQAALAKLAEEAGVDLATWVKRFDDAEDAGNALMKLVADKRGWHLLDDATEGLLNRVLVNGRSAMNGRIATLAADDLVKLRQAAQQPGFWDKLGTAAAWIEESARIGDKADPIQVIRLLYSGDDLAFLKALTESTDLARLADRVATGASVADDAVKTVMLGDDAVRTVMLGDDAVRTVLLGEDAVGTVLLNADDLAKTQILDDPLAITRILNGADDTVILGAHQLPTMVWRPVAGADAATAATQILDAGMTAPTVFLHPGATAPTLLLHGDDAVRATTLLFADAATAPTVLLNADAATAATRLFGPGATAPTLVLNGTDAATAATRVFGSASTAPTMLLHGGLDTAPTLLLHGDDAAHAATQLFGTGAAPTLVLAPDAASAGTVLFGSGATAPTVLFHGDDAARAATQIFGSASSAPTVILHGDDAAHAATVLFGDAATAPTLLLAPDAATAARQVFGGSAATAPTLLFFDGAAARAGTIVFDGADAATKATQLLGNQATMPTLILHGDDAAHAATQLFANPAQMPTLILGDAAHAGTLLLDPAASAPTVFFGGDAATAATQLFGDSATMPTLLLHGDDAAHAATQLFGHPTNLPTLILSPDALSAPTVMLNGAAADAATLQFLGVGDSSATLLLHGDDAARAATQVLPFDPFKPAFAPPGGGLGSSSMVGTVHPSGVSLFGAPFSAVRQAAQPAFATFPTLVFGSPSATGDVLAATAGIDVSLTIVARGSTPLVDVHAAVTAAAVARQGWHRLPATVALTIDRLLHAARAAVAGHGTISPEDVATLHAWAAKAGFYTSLAKAADAVGGGVALRYTEADLNLLQAIDRTGGQVGPLRAALGPLQVAAINAAPRLGGKTASADQVFDAVSGMGHVGLDDFVDQFGITSRFKDGLGWAMAGILWDGFTSPFQTWQQYRFTDRALDLMEAFQANHGNDLIKLGGALSGAVNALEGIKGAIDTSRRGQLLDGRLGAQLSGALDNYRAAFDAAPQEFRDAHAGEMADRAAHIRQKLTQLQTIVSGLDKLDAQLPKMISWVNSLRVGPDGALKSVGSYFNPDAFVRLGSVGLALGQTIGGALLLDGGTEVPPRQVVEQTWPPPSALPAGPGYDDDSSYEVVEHESTMTDEAFERYKRDH